MTNLLRKPKRREALVHMDLPESLHRQLSEAALAAGTTRIGYIRLMLQPETRREASATMRVFREMADCIGSYAVAEFTGQQANLLLRLHKRAEKIMAAHETAKPGRPGGIAEEAAIGGGTE